MLEQNDASSLLECAILLPVLVTLMLGSVDFGRAWYVNQEITAAAEAGALYGLQNPSDAGGMQAAALLAVSDVPSLTAVAKYGAECSDGTGAVANVASVPGCSTNSVEFVEVDTSAVYRPFLPFALMSSALTMNSKSRMRSSF